MVDEQVPSSKSEERRRKIEEDLYEDIRRKEARKMKARRESHRGLWFGLGMFGLVGWSVAIPTLIGVAVGVWLDKRYPGPYSWTLMGLIIGVVLGCLNAWFWVKRESQRE